MLIEKSWGRSWKMTCSPLTAFSDIFSVVPRWDAILAETCMLGSSLICIFLIGVLNENFLMSMYLRCIYMSIYLTKIVFNLFTLLEFFKMWLCSNSYNCFSFVFKILSFKVLFFVLSVSSSLSYYFYFSNSLLGYRILLIPQACHLGFLSCKKTTEILDVSDNIIKWLVP